MEKASRWFVSLVVAIAVGLIRSCHGHGMYGFDIHHRFSEPVKAILGIDEVPEKGSFEYYKVLVEGDQFFRGRHLASHEKSTLAFYPRNETIQLSGSFGYLHYANISVGTPSAWYLVALDTGSDLFWLPCDCLSNGCPRGIDFGNGQVLRFNIYSPNASSTSARVTCNSNLCTEQHRCASDTSDCPYQVRYLSNGTSSTGVLVEDVLRLTTDDAKAEDVNANITFGCGTVQTGSFLRGGAPNGLMGLGIEDIAVPSILANGGYTSNSFSMCFGDDGIGRIRFGDNGTSDQSETPFNLRQSHPTYNITVTQISTGGTPADLEFNAIFDSGTSFTYLNDPAYTQITQSFNLQASDDRHRGSASLPFEYCYDLSPNQTSFFHPIVNLTMKGGADFAVNNPVIVGSINGKTVYCLGVMKSNDVNIIGQNFMTGYHVTFDRERLVLGWKHSNCYEETTTLTVKTSDSPKTSPVGHTDIEATTGNKTVIPASGPSGPSGPSNHSTKLGPFTYALFMLILLPFLAIVV